MMEDGTPLRIGDQVRLRPGALPPASQFPHYDVTTFVVAHLDRSREVAGDVQVTIRAVAGAAPPLTVPSESLQRAVGEMTQQGTRRPAADATQPQPLVALLEQIVARLDRQETLLTEIRDALRHHGEAEAPQGHTVRY
jgi:hypothetical protein